MDPFQPGGAPSIALPPPTSEGTEGTAANFRVECVHADRCGGCPIIALPYSEQLALKRGRVVQSVARYASLELVYTEPVLAADPVTGYRTRAKLIVSPSGGAPPSSPAAGTAPSGNVRVGLFAKGGGHQVVDIPDCRVLSPVLAKVTAWLRNRITADEASGGPLAPVDIGFQPGGEPSRTSGAIRALDLREVHDADGSPRVLVTLVVQRAHVADLEALRTAARELTAAHPEVVGVAANFHDGEAPQILGNETILLHGVPSAADRLGSSTHLATFGSFVQAHRGQAERVHAVLADALGIARAKAQGKVPRILDLYGGSGAIALGLAAAGAEVRLVESFSPAAAHAQQAAEAQGLLLKAECSDVATALRTLQDRGEKFDAAIVNPPRRGMSATAREWLARFDLGVIAYVSCDPDTLARDLDHLWRLGYTTATLRPLDMIPLTDEVETVAILRKTALPVPRVAYEDAELLIVEKGPHEPTAPQQEYAGSLLARARRIPGAENATPIHRIDIGTSGLVMLAKDPKFVAKWSEVLAAPMTRKIYVAATRGVTPSKGAITRELREDGKLYAARTRYRRLAVASGHSVLRVIPEQGRTHQIRRHLAAIGHPVLGDDRYGHSPTNRFFEEKNGLDRAFLHCVRIEIDHPEMATRLVVEAPLPGDLRAVLERTSGPGTLRFLDHKNALGTSGSGISSLPPPPDSFHERGSPLSMDQSSVTLHPELINDDEDDSGRPGTF